MAPKTKNTAATETEAPITPEEQRILAAIQGWEKDDVGFAPYFKVTGKGDFFFGKVCMIDNRQPDFVRVVIEAGEDTKCQRGPVDGAEEVVVAKGDYFTVSAYAGLPVDRYFDMPIYAKIIDERSLPPTPEMIQKGERAPRKFYDWEVRISPENKKLLTARRREEMAMLMSRRTLGEGEVLAGTPQLGTNAVAAQA